MKEESKNKSVVDSHSNLRLKICGMREPENIREVLGLQPDYLGFIFYEKSSRYVLSGNCPPFEGWDFLLHTMIPPPIFPSKGGQGATVKFTGVFVNSDFNFIQKNIKEFKLNAIQLHGKETQEFCQKLKKENVEIIKVFSVDDDFDFEKTKPYEPHCDLFLFDTKGKLPGGNGYTFNWKVLEKYNGELPFFLSGGIGLESVESLKKFHHPKLYGIDVNSKFEIEPGLKDVEMLKEFIGMRNLSSARNFIN